MSVSSQIIEVLNDLCMKFGMAIDWTEENVMPRVEELMAKYISWEIASSWAWICIAGAIILVATVFIVLDSVNFWSDYVLTVFMAFVIIGMLCLIGCQIFDIVQCKVFPEKTIFETIRQLTQ